MEQNDIKKRTYVYQNHKKLIQQRPRQPAAKGLKAEARCWQPRIWRWRWTDEELDRLLQGEETARMEDLES